MVHEFGLATCEGGNTTSICLLQSPRKLMLLASGLWILYDLLLSGRTFTIPEGKYLASIISSVCYTVGWRAESCFAQGSCSTWCVLRGCAAVVHISCGSIGQETQGGVKEVGGWYTEYIQCLEPFALGCLHSLLHDWSSYKRRQSEYTYFATCGSRACASYPIEGWITFVHTSESPGRGYKCVFVACITGEVPVNSWLEDRQA